MSEAKRSDYCGRMPADGINGADWTKARGA
jgi:hypothetical protein